MLTVLLDPYCVVGLLDAKDHEIDHKQAQYRTPVIKKTLNPSWADQKFELYVLHDNTLKLVIKLCSQQACCGK